MIGVLGHDSAMLRLYWAGDNLGEFIVLEMIYRNNEIIMTCNNLFNIKRRKDYYLPLGQSFVRTL